MSRVVLSGDRAGWLSAVANTLMDRSADQAALSTTDLLRLVPDKVGTARNDGHVTAAESGLDRDDYRAGYRLWIDGTVAALRRARLVDGPDNALRWVDDRNETHRVMFCGERRTIHGRPQRQQSRDRYMLGDPKKDWMSPSLGSDGRVLRGDIPPLTVNVRTHNHGKEYIREHRLEIHPLALAIPPMTPEEQQLLRADIQQHGVETPLVLYPDRNDLTANGKPKKKVLDGRHRAYFASVTGQPIELDEFEGSEQEARDYVVSLNLRRRHLTRQQMALAAARLYGKQARDETDADRKPRGDRGRDARMAPDEIAESQNGQQERKPAHERVWEMAGGEASGFSKTDAKAALKVAEHAPQTAEAIDRGDVKNTATVNQMATRESAGLNPSETRRSSVGENLSIDVSLVECVGKCLYFIRLAEDERRKPSAGSDAKLAARLDEIIERAQRVKDTKLRPVA